VCKFWGTTRGLRSPHRSLRQSPLSEGQGAKPPKALVFCFWTFNGCCKFAHFLKFGLVQIIYFCCFCNKTKCNRPQYVIVHSKVMKINKRDAEITHISPNRLYLVLTTTPLATFSFPTGGG